MTRERQDRTETDSTETDRDRQTGGGGASVVGFDALRLMPPPLASLAAAVDDLCGDGIVSLVVLLREETKSINCECSICLHTKRETYVFR